MANRLGAKSSYPAPKRPANSLNNGWVGQEVAICDLAELWVGWQEHAHLLILPHGQGWPMGLLQALPQCGRGAR